MEQERVIDYPERSSSLRVTGCVGLVPHRSALFQIETTVYTLLAALVDVCCYYLRVTQGMKEGRAAVGINLKHGSED